MKKKKVNEIDLDKLIQENLSEEEIVDLEKEGFSKEQIAYVAKSHKESAKIPHILDWIAEILSWIVPLK